MRPARMAAFSVFAVTVVAACGESQETPANRPARTAEASEVPEGVRAQSATIEEEVRAEGGEQNVGPWRIAYIVEPAEGWFEPRGDNFEWRAPAAGETHHIEILPIEAKTGRVVPNVPITVEALDSDGEQVAREALKPYYAEFFHYANNFAIPRPGEYTLKATIEPPDLRRHGEEQEGPALAEGAQVEFEGVRLEVEEGA